MLPARCLSESYNSGFLSSFPAAADSVIGKWLAGLVAGLSGSLSTPSRPVDGGSESQSGSLEEVRVNWSAMRLAGDPLAERSLSLLLVLLHKR